MQCNIATEIFVFWGINLLLTRAFVLNSTRQGSGFELDYYGYRHVQNPDFKETASSSCVPLVFK